jgi:hypothetical protein
MVADMLLVGLPRFKATDDRIQQLRDIVANSTAIESGDHFGGNNLEEWKQYMMAAIDDISDFDYTGEVSGISIEGGKYPLWISGGLSWGDDPTEAFYSICTLADCELMWDMIRKWAIEDNSHEPQNEYPDTSSQNITEPDERELRRRRDKQLKRALGF